MQELTFRIPGFEIAAKTWGKKTSSPLLALHGWLDNANSFDQLAPYLERDYYLIAIDLPGHGLSSHLPEGCYYHFIDGIFTVVNIIDALHLTNIHLLGHSMGACLASLVAGVIPERILSMALIEALGPFSAPEEACCKQLTTYLDHLDAHEKKPKPYSSFEQATHARTKDGYLSYEHACILCKRGVVQKNEKFYWRHDRRLIHTTPLKMTEAQILSCLQEIKAPGLLMLANNGFAFNQDLMQKRIKAVKNLQVEYMTGGHHLHMEHPGAVYERLVNFYK